MTFEDHQHSFAKVWLDFLGNRIIINGKEPFRQNLDECKKYFRITPLKTEIVVGRKIITDEEFATVTDISHSDLVKTGLKIYRIPAGPLRWKQRQESILIIEKESEKMKPYELPAGTFTSRSSRKGIIRIQINRDKKCVQGTGPDFGTRAGKDGPRDCTGWVHYGNIIPKSWKNLRGYHGKENPSTEELMTKIDQSWSGQEVKDDRKIIIKEMPLMRTESGSLICLPFDPDFVPKILIIGVTGRGKSLATNSILGRAFYCFEDNIGMINDASSQFYDWSLPMDNPMFLDTLSLIGNEPKYLPVVTHYMSCPNLMLKYGNEQVAYRLVISFKEFLERLDFYTEEISDWQLSSKKYITPEVINELIKCRSTKEIRDTLMRVIPFANDPKKGDAMQMMINKICAVFDQIFNNQFTDNLFTDEPLTSPEWKLITRKGKEFKGHPFIISLYAGVTPVVNNMLAKYRPITRVHIVDLLRKIPQWQNERKAEGNLKRIWLGFDELADFLKRKNDSLYLALDDLFAQGRFPMVGFVGNIQEYSMLSDRMRNNTKHLIIYNLRTDAERKLVAKDYNIESSKLDAISTLRDFECFFTTTSATVEYTIDGQKKFHHEGGLWRGFILPPLNTHKKPSDI